MEIKTLNPVIQFKRRNPNIESVDAIYAKKIFTFEDLNQIDNNGQDAFDPRDFLDLDADDKDDEILGKFEVKYPKQTKATKKV